MLAFAAALLVLASAPRAEPPEARETELPLVPELRARGLDGLAGFAEAHGEDKVRAFLRHVPADHRPDELRDFHRSLSDALKGGPLDPDGEVLRSALRALPAEEWYFVAELQQSRSFIIDNAGVSSWAKNVADTFWNVPMVGEELNKCRARSANVLELMDKTRLPAEAWSYSPLQTRLRSNAADRRRQHNAPCFSFEGEGGPVEVVADSWKNQLVRADVWWRKWDPPSSASIFEQCGRYCGPCYCGWLVDSYFLLDGKDPAATEPAARAHYAEQLCPSRWSVASRLEAP